MAAKSETIARQFEAKAQEATAVFERLTDADWKKVTAAEKWSVGVTAHHIAVAHGVIAGLVKTLADGKPGPNIPMDALHGMNAKHAQEHASCTRAETIALHKKNVAATAAMVRALSDEQLDRSGNVIAGAPAMSAGQLAGGLLCSHIDEHLGSIKATVAA
jgi:hypothetical protein